MAKEVRFPSDANKKKPAKKAAEAPAKAVEGAKQALVQVEYKQEKHHHLHSVYALRKGLNHLPEQVWAWAKQHPSVQKLIADGHLVESKAAKAAEVEAEEEATEEQAAEGSEEQQQAGA